MHVIVQTCIVHPIRSTLHPASKRDWDEFIPFVDYDTEIPHCHDPQQRRLADKR
jgi:transposase-like protein